MDSTSINELLDQIIQFRNERDWAQFHTIKNLTQALIVEAAELNEVVQWKDETEIQSELLDPEFKKKLSDECADVFVYLLLISERMGIDLIEVARSKVQENAKKYPVERSKGSAKKYNEL